MNKLTFNTGLCYSVPKIQTEYQSPKLTLLVVSEADMNMMDPKGQTVKMAPLAPAGRYCNYTVCNQC